MLLCLGMVFFFCLSFVLNFLFALLKCLFAHVLLVFCLCLFLKRERKNMKIKLGESEGGKDLGGNWQRGNTIDLVI